MTRPERQINDIVRESNAISSMLALRRIWAQSLADRDEAMRRRAARRRVVGRSRA